MLKSHCAGAELRYRTVPSYLKLDSFFSSIRITELKFVAHQNTNPKCCLQFQKSKNKI